MQVSSRFISAHISRLRYMRSLRGGPILSKALGNLHGTDCSIDFHVEYVSYVLRYESDGNYLTIQIIKCSESVMFTGKVKYSLCLSEIGSLTMR